MRTRCPTCGAILPPGHKRYCNEVCHQKELEYQRQYHREHKKKITDEQRRRNREYTREWKKRQKALGNTPKEPKYTLAYFQPSGLWGKIEPLGRAISEPGR